MAASRLSGSSRQLSRVSQVAARSFSSRATGDWGWRNATPPGSNTEVFVYTPSAVIAWPDSSLGVLGGQSDPNFQLPGNIGQEGSARAHTQPIQVHPREPLHGLNSPQEGQVAALHMAHDYLRYSPGSEGAVCLPQPLLTAFPGLSVAERREVTVHAAPTLLRRELVPLFPGREVSQGSLSCLTLCLRTETDMSCWSEEMEEEREALTHELVVSAKEVCGRLREEGHWADFIDPSSGTPHFSAHTNSSLGETHESMRLLGLHIEDLGCCKVLEHREWGRHVMLGLVITDASSNSDILANIVADLTI